MIPFNEQHYVLELGGGENPMFRPNLDIRPLPTVDVVADFNNQIPFENNTFDGVYSSYVIEHISWRKVRAFISEIYRILKPNGITFIVTANLLEQCKRFISTPTITDNEVCMIFGGQDYGANAHACGFSPEYALQLFKEAGFNSVITVAHPNCETDMIIEARK